LIVSFKYINIKYCANVERNCYNINKLIERRPEVCIADITENGFSSHA